MLILLDFFSTATQLRLTLRLSNISAVNVLGHKQGGFLAIRKLEYDMMSFQILSKFYFKLNMYPSENLSVNCPSSVKNTQLTSETKQTPWR